MAPAAVTISTLLLAFCVLDAAANTVDLDGLGTLVGSKTLTYSGQTVVCFYGVYYAEAPVGQRRFWPPAAKKMNGTFDATKAGKSCYQPTAAAMSNFTWNKGFTNSDAEADPGMDEDCLNLNICTSIVPSTINKSTELLPVLVYIHGGSFTTGSNRLFNPFLMLDRKAVLITPNYRLGPFGFLSMNNNDIPGNAGLHDIVLALKWVQCHVSKFGGDPKKVTLIGHGTGAAMAQMIANTPIGEGLVNQLMLFSGSAMEQTVIDNDPISEALILAKNLGCDTPGVDTMMCLKTKPADQIIKAFTKMNVDTPFVSTFTPVLSRPDDVSGNVFMTEYFSDAVNKGKFRPVPTIALTTTYDSSRYVNYIYWALINDGNKHLNSTFITYELVPYILNLIGYTNYNEALLDSIECRYFSNLPTKASRGVFSALLPGLRDFLSYYATKGPILQYMKACSKRTKCFLCNFSQKTNFHCPGCGVDNFGSLYREGPTYFDDMYYLTKVGNVKLPSTEMPLSVAMWNAFYNFMLAGDPNLGPLHFNFSSKGYWNPYSHNEGGQYLALKNLNIKVLDGYTTRQSTPALKSTVA